MRNGGVLPFVGCHEVAPVPSLRGQKGAAMVLPQRGDGVWVGDFSPGGTELPGGPGSWESMHMGRVSDQHWCLQGWELEVSSLI